MSHEMHRLSVRGNMDTSMRERRMGRGEGETLSIHVVLTQCALGLRAIVVCMGRQHDATGLLEVFIKQLIFNGAVLLNGSNQY